MRRYYVTAEGRGFEAEVGDAPPTSAWCLNARGRWERCLALTPAALAALEAHWEAKDVAHEKALQALQGAPGGADGQSSSRGHLDAARAALERASSYLATARDWAAANFPAGALASARRSPRPLASAFAFLPERHVTVEPLCGPDYDPWPDADPKASPRPGSLSQLGLAHCCPQAEADALSAWAMSLSPADVGRGPIVLRLGHGMGPVFVPAVPCQVITDPTAWLAFAHARCSYEGRVGPDAGLLAQLRELRALLAVAKAA